MMQVEIENYKPINKGMLKAYFSLVEYPSGRKTLDCRYLTKDDESWFAFPQKEWRRKGSDKIEYIPFISYKDKDYLDELKVAVLAALKEKANEATNTKQAGAFQDDASSVWYG